MSSLKSFRRRSCNLILHVFLSHLSISKRCNVIEIGNCQFLSKPHPNKSRQLESTAFGFYIQNNKSSIANYFLFYLFSHEFQPEYYKDATHFRSVIGNESEYRLEIPHAKLDYTGTYSVIATNCYGQAKAIISLQIYAKGETDL